MAKEFLSNENAPFVEYDVSKDSAALKDMINLSGARSVPVIVGCDKVIIGFDKGKVLEMIDCVKSRAAGQ